MASGNSYTILLLTAGLVLSATTHAQQPDSENPPTTLPFEPTVRSAPPERPTYPQQPEAPPPGDPFCREIGPVIRAGVIATRFASLSPATAGGAVIGTFEAGEETASLGADYCTVTIPAASPQTADAPYNQVTCQLDIVHSDAAFLDDMRTRRDELAARIADCPATALWNGEAPEAETPGNQALSEPYIFSHPDVAVEIVIDATHRPRQGEWPLAYMRTLSLNFRTPNPDRPEPEPEDSPPGSALP